jgi:predicted RNA binding protein YcfA (HicA-like mRNA interferase family)
MPNGLFNWTYRDVTAFLKEHGFEFFEERAGSHEAWFNKKTNRVVELQFHAKASFRPKTLESMIRQSGIEKKAWRTWNK